LKAVEIEFLVGDILHLMMSNVYLTDFVPLIVTGFDWVLTGIGLFGVTSLGTGTTSGRPRIFLAGLLKNCDFDSFRNIASEVVRVLES